MRTFDFDAEDGEIRVWQHAFDLRAFGKTGGEEMVILYHFTDELAFRNIGNLEQSQAELFASLVDKHALCGKGLYATKHEPAVWGSRFRILLNNYTNEYDPQCPDTEDVKAQLIRKRKVEG